VPLPRALPQQITPVRKRSVEQQKDLVMDAKVANEGNGWAGSGGNPWHLDDDTESILFLTNESDEPTRMGFSVTANDVQYYLTKLRLNPHETRVIDLRKLRDAQTADFRGNRVPAAATDGSVHWIRLDPVPVMGRLMVIHRQQGMASNYDCCTCPCPPTSSPTLEMSPSSVTLLVGTGTGGQFLGNDVTIDCNGDHFYDDVTDSSTWTSSVRSVATVSNTSPKGLVTAVGGGSTNIAASYPGTPCVRKLVGCACTQVPAAGQAPANVQVPTYVSVKGTPATGPFTCSGGFNTRYLQTYYQVLDSSKAPIQSSGMSVQEQLSWTSSTCATSDGCGQKPTASTWTTDSTGTITQPDTILNCSSTCTHGGSCSEDWQQTFSVNGYPVGIVNGSTTGSVNCIATSCTSTPQGTTH